jgi:3-hydroxyacyl-CoA dehydrogenase
MSIETAAVAGGGLMGSGIVELVTLGYFGRKSGRGFYDYSRNTPVPVALGF